MDLSEEFVGPVGIPKDVAQLFERFALDVIRVGFTRFSSDAILHRIRWYVRIEQGHREFKCNNNWTPYLARWFVARYPKHSGLFELRRLSSGGP